MDIEARIAKHIEHLLVFRKDARREVLEVLIPSIQRETLEQRRRDPPSMELVVDGKRHLGARVRVGEIRTDADNLRALFASPADDQRERVVRLVVIAQLSQQFV